MEPRSLARCTGLRCRSACEGSALLECQVKRGLCSADPLCLLSGGVCMQVPSLIPRRVRQASLLRVSNAGIPEGGLGGMEARFAGGVGLLLMAIGTSACTGVISPPRVPKIYVADASNHRIVRMDTMTGAGWTVLGGPSAGSGMNQFSSPTGIFVSAGQIYVADWNNNRIVRMNDMAGTGWTAFGTLGSGMNQFDGPFGVSVSAGQIYVADRNNNRIVRMNDMTGVGWTEFGTFGNGPNQFSRPFGIFVSAGQIFVVDTFNSRIVRMDDMTGAGWTPFGTSGSGPNQFNLPVRVFLQ